MLLNDKNTDRILKNADKKQRFGLRKLSVGVASVLLGFTFTTYGTNSVVHAAEPVQTGTSEQEKVKTGDSAVVAKSQENAAPVEKVTPVEKETKAEPAEKAVPVKRDVAKAKAAESADKAKKDETVDSKKVKDSAVTDQSDKDVAADSKTKGADGADKDAGKITKKAVEKKLVPKKIEARSEEPDHVDTSVWHYSDHREQGVVDGIVLDGINPGKENDVVKDGKIIVPNSYDFERAGIISSGQKVYIDSYFRRNTNNGNNVHDQYGTPQHATEFIISHNGKGKVYAEGNWGDGFNGVPYQTMDLTNLDVSKVNNMSQMFCWDMNLRQLKGLDNWDTSSVGTDPSPWNPNNMASMFLMCPNLQELNLSKWDTSHVTSMSAMFEADGSLTSVGDLSNWNLQNVKSTREMFEYDGNLSFVGNLDNWDVHNVGDMYGMFNGDTNLTSVGDIRNWDVSNVTNTGYMFAFCPNLRTIGDLSNWDVGHDTNADHMFGGCNQLTSLGDLQNWNVGNITNASCMFGDCGKLRTIGDVHNWDVRNITDSSYMFSGAGITNFNISHWQLINDRNVQGMLWLNDPNDLMFAAFINMMDVNLPLTHFDLHSFLHQRSDDHLIVYSNDPNVLALNATIGANGQVDYNNHLHKANQISIVTSNFEPIADIPAYKVVFNGQNDFIKFLRSLTTKEKISNLVKSKFGNKFDVADSDFVKRPDIDNEDALDHDYTMAEPNSNQDPTTNPLALILLLNFGTEGKNYKDGSYYLVDVQSDEYKQYIHYVDDDDNDSQVGQRVLVSDGYLDEHNQAIISKDAINSAIENNIPKGYNIVSGLLTHDVTIDKSNPADIVVHLRRANEAAQIIYVDPSGNTVANGPTISGKFKETKHVTFNVPEGYRLADTQLPEEDYTFTSDPNQQILVRVVAIPDHPTTPDKPHDKPTIPPVTPTNPDQKPTNPTNPTDHNSQDHPEKPQIDDQPGKPSDSNKQSNSSTKKAPTKLAKSASHARLVTPNTTRRVQANKRAPQIGNYKTARKLPQTGENKAALIGLAMGAALVVLGLVVGKKRES